MVGRKLSCATDYAAKIEINIDGNIREAFAVAIGGWLSDRAGVHLDNTAFAMNCGSLITYGDQLKAVAIEA